MDEISYSGTGGGVKRKLSKRLVVFGTSFVIILLLLGGLTYFVTKKDSKQEVTKSITLPPEESITEEPTPTPEQSPTPTKKTEKVEEITEDKSGAIKVAVQNGSGEGGAAASAAAILRSAGFAIASTGNADNFDYTDVTIQVKNSKKSILSDLEAALSKEYTIGTTSTDLSEGQGFDALVIVGK